MSIYCTALTFEDDAAPLLYQGSHIMPTADDPRGNQWQAAGDFELAEIPGYVPHDGRAHCSELGECDGTCVYPWLRVSIGESVVVLTEDQVRQVHEYTGRWLARVEETRADSAAGNVGGPA